MIARLSLLFLSILISLCINAQSDGDWYRVDTSVAKKRNLQDQRKVLFQWREQAMEKQDYGNAARCLNYLMVIADKTTEDTLFFRNALFMDSILNSTQSPEQLKAIIHVLKAKRIASFKSRHYWKQNKMLFSSYDPLRNYSAMPVESLDSVIDFHFEKALQIGKSLPGFPVRNLTWLASDPNAFLFDPGFADIVYAERINTLYNPSVREPLKFASRWLQLSQDAFIQLDSLDGFSAKSGQVFGYYKQWLQHHADNPRAYYFIETLARKYFFNLLHSDSLNNKLYERYLQNLLASPYNTVKAHAVYQLCLLWNEEARKYNPYSTVAEIHYTAGILQFNERYRMHHVKAIELFRQHAPILDSFSMFNKLLRAMAIRMREIELGLTMEDELLPGKPMLASLRFRNARNMYIRVIRLSYDEKLWRADKKKNFERLTSASYLSDTVISLKTPNDYQLHNTFIKLDPLPAGRYIILYSDSVIAIENKHLDFLDLHVTRIAAINNDDRVFVLDRETGFPLTGAQVRVRLENPQTVNNEGYATVNVEKYNGLTIWYKGDTVNYSANQPDQYQPDELYDKEEYLDLLEYYEDNTRLHLFTDRAIYRPGQTVYYKGIFMVPHPRTGEQLVLNWKNLKFPFFKKLYYKLARTFSGRKMEIYINDPFGNERDTILVLPDKFGSISGSFKIPADAATGEWEFDNLDVEMDEENTGMFSVEEYKRPSFEIKLERPAGDLRLGDSFTVKAIARSFAGAQLNNVLVNYTVTARGNMPAANDEYSYRNDTIIDGEAYTDENGELKISVADRKISDIQFPADRKWSTSYHVYVEAVEATGESHKEDDSYELSTRPVIFDLTLPYMMERNELPSIYIGTRTNFAGLIKKQVNVKIFSVQEGGANINGEEWPLADIYLYDSLELIRWFPETKNRARQKTDDILVHQTNLLASDTGRLLLPAAALPAGNYRMEITAWEDAKIIGEIKKQFSVFDRSLAELPDAENGFEYLPFTAVRAGEKFTWYTGNKGNTIYSIYHAAWYEKNTSGKKIKYHYTVRPEKKGLNQWEFRIPGQALDHITITHLYIVNNRLYRKERQVYIVGPVAARPEIIVEKYRTKLAPGAKETFTVSIKTKNENVVAQLMTTMYDATLDKLVEHKWKEPYARVYFNIRNSWNHMIDGRISSRLANVWRAVPDQYGYREPLWWLNPLDYGADLDRDGDGALYVSGTLVGKVAGISITDTRGLNEVVVVGYSSVKKNLLSSVVVNIRGINSLSGYGKILYVLDGQVFEGDVSTINLNSLVEGVILKGADAIALYGSRAANGVLLLSTRGRVQLPETPKPPAPVIRKNFSETAFFYPRIHAGRNGIYTIRFTLSESVTTWKWKMLAHTKNAAFAYLEKTLISQLPLMVQPDMPRFLYQGDKIVLKSRISNLDTAACTGQLECTLEDMVTGEDLTKQLTNTSRNNFSIARSSNSTGSFEIQIPENLLHPLRIRITALSRSYSDGEEYVIPILARKILVAHSVPVVLNDQKKNNISIPTLPADAQPYGMALFITPQPQAALINALPCLANYQYGCAEQTFNKMLAHAIAVKMVRTDTTLQQLLKRNIFSKSSGAAPDELPEESMPWLQLNNRHAVQQRQLAKLFNTLATHAAMQKFFDELMKLQKDDGGITWFPGGKSNDYISAYILAGFGKLFRDELPLPDERLTEHMRFIVRLINYCDARFLERYEYKLMNLFYLYARSFWTKRYSLPTTLLPIADSLITNYWQTQNFSAVGNASLLAIATLRMLPTENVNHAKAIEYLESLRQSAIRDEKNGIRWKTYADTDDLNMHMEEWVVKTAEAFEEDANDKETIPGMITWLLKTRSEYSWSTTKSTADAVSLLHRKQPAFIAKPLQMEAAVNETSLRVTNDLFTGNHFAFKDMTGKTFPELTAVTTPIAQGQSGGINYYYFTADPPAEETATGVKIVKAISKYNSSTSAWEALSASTILKPGDKLRTTLTITTVKQLQYVFIDEKRAAACEPAEALSGYEYGKGISYYKSVRDVGFQFFADQVPAGISEISYETVVAKTGRFTYGPAALQCMYRPDIKAYSNSLRIDVKE